MEVIINDDKENKSNNFYKKTSVFDLIGKYKLLKGLISDYKSGVYRKISPISIITLIGGLIYIVSPVDFIPDIIPVVGWIDDVGVFAFVYKLVNDELEKYSKWKSQQAN